MIGSLLHSPSLPHSATAPSFPHAPSGDAEISLKKEVKKQRAETWNGANFDQCLCLHAGGRFSKVVRGRPCYLLLSCFQEQDVFMPLSQQTSPLLKSFLDIAFLEIQFGSTLNFIPMVLLENSKEWKNHNCFVYVIGILAFVFYNQNWFFFLEFAVCRWTNIWRNNDINHHVLNACMNKAPC